MGFWDSFSGGVSNFFSGVGSVITSVAGSPIGQTVLSNLGQWGISELDQAIGTTPVYGRGPAPGPLGTPTSPYITGSISYPRPDQVLTPEAIREELAFYQPGGPGSPVRGAGPAPLRPNIALPPPSVPASQPYGAMPGATFASYGGPAMPAFPVSTQQGYPPSPWAAVAGGAMPASYAPAGVAGSLLRQLPGMLGGLAIGEGYEMLAGGGGGTPMFRPTMAGARAQFFRTQNPATGQDTWFRPAGRPLLWSGDLTACKRVKKIARRASRKR